MNAGFHLLRGLPWKRYVDSQDFEKYKPSANFALVCGLGIVARRLIIRVGW
jgi:hypothetical protein